jgi:hypothetical protein
MKGFFLTFCLGWFVSIPSFCFGQRVVGIELKLLEMSLAQALELNLGMKPTLVGRRESGEPIYQQSIGEDFWGKLGSMEGVESIDVPRLSVQVGRRGEVQVGKEIRYPASRDPSTGRIIIGQKFIGYEILAVPQAGDGDIAVDMAVQVLLREMPETGEFGDRFIVAPKFVESLMRSRPVIIPGKSISFGELEKGDGTRVMVIGKVSE